MLSTTQIKYSHGSYFYLVWLDFQKPIGPPIGTQQVYVAPSTGKTLIIYLYEGSENPEIQTSRIFLGTITHEGDLITNIPLDIHPQDRKKIGKAMGELVGHTVDLDG